MLNDNHRKEIEKRLEAIRNDPERLRRYDVNGDGVIDADEWVALERAITLEVQTELRRAQKASNSGPESKDALQILGDRYEVLDLLGEGAQGRTHRGRDHQTGAIVAIKELSIGQLDDWKAIDLFEREGKVLKNLNHPGIPAYVDAFHLADPDGQERFFLIQEFVDGNDFETLVDQGLSMSEEEAEQFLRQVLGILVYLQERSPPVIHRDLKPSNIMRRRDGSLVLIDFGAVQSVIPDGRGGSTIIGTSGYMPIEQLYGRATAATDLYALGATVVHLLSGRHPADLPMREMRLGFEPYINVSTPFKRFLQRLLDPVVERRIKTAKEALLTLEGLHRQEPQPERPSQWRPENSRPQLASTSVESFDDPPSPPKGYWQRIFDEHTGLVFGLITGIGSLGFFALLIGFIYWAAPGNDEERCQARAHVDSLESCMRWGQDLEAAQEFSRALHAYQQGCSNSQENYSPACARGALLAFETRHDDADALALKACDLGEGLGCAVYAQIRLRRYLDGPQEVDDDLHEMRRYADKACTRRSPRGCAQLAVAEALLGDLEAAGRAARRSRELDEHNLFASLSLGLLQVSEGNIDVARQLIVTASEKAQVATGIEAPHSPESFDAAVELSTNAFDFDLP